MIYTLKNETLTVEISSRGAEIISIKENGSDKEYIWHGEEFWFKHSPLLFPICGSITDPCTYRGKEYKLSKHGFISTEEFSSVSVSDSELVLTARDTESTRAAYPFSFEFTATYILQGKSLTSRYQIKNLSGETMPYMFGLHPAFVLHGDAPKEEFYLDFGEELTATQYRLVAPFVNQNGFDRLIPHGRLNITNEIYDKDTIILEGTDRRIDFVSPYGKVFGMEWSDGFNILCVWKWPDDRARYICIEPWTSIPSDGSVTDNLEVKNMKRLGVGETDEYSYTLNFC